MAKIRPATQLRAGSASASGSANVTAIGTGAAVAQAATVSGTGAIVDTQIGTGALVAQSASIAATVAIERTGSGFLASQAASVSGSGIVSSGSLDEDYAVRTGMQGVVWHHDFASDAEVDSFRWINGKGNDFDDTEDPGKCIRDTGQSITGGGSLALKYDNVTLHAPGWWRPFAPMSAASTGKSGADPADQGTVTLASWNPQNTGENEAFREAYYAHPDYYNQSDTGITFTPADFNGQDFWIQFRMRLDSARYATGGGVSTTSAGKQYFLATTQTTLNQEIVQTNEFNAITKWYTKFGQSPDTGGYMGVSSGTKHPGGDYDQCGVGGNCWSLPGDEWVKFMLHLVPGHHNTKDTLFEVYVARANENRYELLFRQRNTIDFSNNPNTGHPFGWNTFQPSNYFNNLSSTLDWWLWFDQIIFSHQPIPVQLAAPTVMQNACKSLSPGQFVDSTTNTTNALDIDTQWQTVCVYYDVVRRELQYMGKPASSQSQNHSHYVYDEVTDAWSTSGTALFPGFGHIWTTTYDPWNSKYYFRQTNSNLMRVYDSRLGTWGTTASQTSPALNAGNADLGAIGWHPNLFGPGLPGIFCLGVFRSFAYDVENDTWSVLNPSNLSSSSPYFDRRNGQAVYLPESDQLIIFAAQGGAPSDVAVLVEAGAGASSDIVADGLISTTASPPITVSGLGGTAQQGMVVPHPDDYNHLLLLEEHGSARVWQSVDHGASWQLQSYTHPFDGNASPPMPSNSGETGGFTCGFIPVHRRIVGVTTNGSGGNIRYWRPG